MMADIFSFDTEAAQAALTRLDRACKDGLRPAAQAGAQVAYDGAVAKVARIGVVTGNLRRALYQAFSRDESGPDKATYHISWNPRKAPHGQLVEYGHIQSFKVYVGANGRWYTSKTPLPEPRRVGAQSFIRATYDEKAAAIGEAMAAKMVKEIDDGL